MASLHNTVVKVHEEATKRKSSVCLDYFLFFISPPNKHRRSDPGRGMFPVYPRKAQLDPMYLQDGLE